jgi:hypothetical protein
MNLFWELFLIPVSSSRFWLPGFGCIFLCWFERRFSEQFFNSVFQPQSQVESSLAAVSGMDLRPDLGCRFWLLISALFAPLGRSESLDLRVWLFSKE